MAEITGKLCVELEYPLLDLFVNQKLGSTKQPTRAELADCVRGVLNETFQAAVGDYNTLLWCVWGGPAGGRSIRVSGSHTPWALWLVGRVKRALLRVKRPSR